MVFGEKATMGTLLMLSALLLLPLAHSLPDVLSGLTAESSLFDTMTAFGANYGNAVGESAAIFETVGATGSIENIGSFDLRLLRCTNVQGGMSQHFPLIVSPGSESVGISGYGKRSKDQKQNQKRSKIKGVVQNFMALFSGPKTLEQRCLYAIYDAEEDANGQWTERRIHTKDATSLPATATEADKKKAKTSTQYIEFRIKVKEGAPNEIGVKFAASPIDWSTSGRGTWTWPGQQKAETKTLEKPSQTINNKKTTSQHTTASMHRCSYFNDICVEASIGTSSKPRFRFVIMPMKYTGLTSKTREGYESVTEYCDMIGYYFGYENDSEEAKAVYENKDSPLGVLCAADAAPAAPAAPAGAAPAAPAAAAPAARV